MLSEQAVAAALSPKFLNLIILPTEKCNFRCTYCYEDFAVGRMKSPTVQAIKKLIARRVPELQHLSLSWFGGEPLLAKAVVQEIGSFAHDLCVEHGVHFESGFTTNGYLLTPELVEYFASISHRDYQITLDGDEVWHNKTRVLANRGPTFERIWSNLTGFKDVKVDFKVCLRLHIHRDNIESQKRLYERLQSEILTDKRFSSYFHKVSNLSTDWTISETVLDRKDYLEAIDYIMGPRDKTPSEPISEEHLDGYICYAAKPNSLMIRANGDLGKCTVALADDRNHIGHINEDGTLDISNPKLQKWFSGFANMSEQTLGCPLSTLSQAQ
jgi:uncharacterized protein